MIVHGICIAFLSLTAFPVVRLFVLEVMLMD